MTTKTTGAEFKSFYNDDAIWPRDGNTWHEDEYVTVDGSDWDYGREYTEMPDAAKVTIGGGIVFSPQFDGNEPSFEAYFKSWRKAQTTEFMSVECSKDKADAVRAAIVAAGGKVK